MPIAKASPTQSGVTETQETTSSSMSVIIIVGLSVAVMLLLALLMGIWWWRWMKIKRFDRPFEVCEKFGARMLCYPRRANNLVSTKADGIALKGCRMSRGSGCSNGSEAARRG